MPLTPVLQVIRRELADNFCHYCPQYDSLEACYDWARDTLRAHAGDKREYVYSRCATDHCRRAMVKGNGTDGIRLKLLHARTCNVQFSIFPAS